MIRSSLLALLAAISFGYSAFGQVKGPVFEVASVKPSPPPSNGRIFFGPPHGGPGTPDPGRISWPNARMISVIMEAFDVKTYQVNGPAWINSETFDIEVKLPEGATKAQVRQMWQNFLAERFGMAVHHESKEFPVRDLMQVKGGAKLKPYQEDASVPKDGPARMENGQLDRPGLAMMIRAGGGGGAPMAHMAAKGQTMEQFAQMLGNQLHLPVVDKTGLSGKYDFDLEFTPDLAGMPLPPGPGPGPGAIVAGGAPPAAGSGDTETNLSSALGQLGLRLASSKGNLDVVVIDKLSRTPTEN